MRCMADRGWIAGLVGLVLAGCAGAPDPMLAEDRPADFSLAATVYRPAAWRPDDTVLPRALRPARYIVEPDGSLHAAIGAGSNITRYPPTTRRLDPRDMDLLWRLTRESGLLEARTAQRFAGGLEAGPAPGTIRGVFEISLDGRWATLVVPLDRSDLETISAERLVDHLAGLAWIPDGG